MSDEHVQRLRDLTRRLQGLEEALREIRVELLHVRLELEARHVGDTQKPEAR